MKLNAFTEMIIGAAMTVHRELGPGLLESVYLTCLYSELETLQLKVRKEVALPVIYRNQVVSNDGFRIDLLVEDLVIVELKSVEKVQPVHAKQLLTYLRLANKSLGLLINFNESMLKDGITRVSNGYGL
jgi:GxxExxY protein